MSSVSEWGITRFWIDFLGFFGLTFLISGLFLLLVSAAAYENPRIRNVETELPDIIRMPQPATGDLEAQPDTVGAGLAE